MKEININIDWVVITFIVFSWFYYFLCYFFKYTYKKCKGGENDNVLLYNLTNYKITIMIPCKNEETVIKNTLKSISSLKYKGDNMYNIMEILVVNDGSTDNTKEIVEAYAETSLVKVHILNVLPAESGQGKGEALNKGYLYLKENSTFNQNKNNHIVAVFDADGHPGKDIIDKLSDIIIDDKVGCVNSSIRIKNRNYNYLTTMQDMEFHIIARYLNFIRGYLFSNAFMGGNGQFMRFIVLDQLYEQDGYVWKAESLTEDLDVGLRSLILGWKTKQLVDGYVYQQGITEMRKLWKQRNRWAWGTLQTCFEYIVNFKIFFRNKMTLFQKIDVFMVLIQPILTCIIIPLAIVLLILHQLNYVNLVFYAHPILMWILVSCWILFPLVSILINEEYLLFFFPSYFIGYYVYIVLLTPTIFYGFFSVLFCRKPHWVKTKR